MPAVEQLRFTKTHEWIESSGKVRKVGISDFAQEQLGDIVFVELPAAGKTVKAGEEACIVESCKATASVYAPVAGKIVAVNRALEEAPEAVNRSPYEEGWFFQIEPAADATSDGLLDHETYRAQCAEE